MADYNSAYTGVQIDANLALAATAVQDADLATVATTGAYSDLTGKPTLGTAAATASTDYATAEQGALADTAVQPADDAADLGSGAATDGYVLTADGAGGAAWEAASGGGGTPGGSDTQVQFNDGGAFGGDSGFTFDKTNNTLGLGGGTITASDPIIDMAQTWNNGAVTFTALKVNVTNTASASASLLMDLQVGGSSRFSVGRTGNIYSGGGGIQAIADSVATDIIQGRWGPSFPVLRARIDNGVPTIDIASHGSFRWSNDVLSVSTIDLILARDAANTLAQRNGTAAQTSRIYGTFTDASNYRRLTKTMSTAGVAEIKPEGAGTGATGNVLHISGLPTSNPGPGILWNNAGTPAIGT